MRARLFACLMTGAACRSTLHHLFELLFDRDCRMTATADKRNRVVSRNRSCDLRQLDSVNPFSQPLCLAPVRPDDHERIYALEAAHERGDRPAKLLAHRRTSAIGAETHVGAIAGTLDEA